MTRAVLKHSKSCSCIRKTESTLSPGGFTDTSWDVLWFSNNECNANVYNSSWTYSVRFLVDHRQSGIMTLVWIALVFIKCPNMATGVSLGAGGTETTLLYFEFWLQYPFITLSVTLHNVPLNQRVNSKRDGVLNVQVTWMLEIRRWGKYVPGI